MSARVALIRGINVGGRRKLPMGELRSMMTDLGWRDVKTYIQSGNAIYSPAVRTSDSASALRREAADLIAAIDSAKGFAPVVMVLTVKALAAHLERSPFRDADAAKAFIVFVDGDPAPFGSFEPSGAEEMVVVDGVVHLHLPDGVGQSKLGAKIAASKRPAATVRNLRTVAKLLEMRE